MATKPAQQTPSSWGGAFRKTIYGLGLGAMGAYQIASLATYDANVQLPRRDAMQSIAFLFPIVLFMDMPAPVWVISDSFAIKKHPAPNNRVDPENYNLAYYLLSGLFWIGAYAFGIVASVLFFMNSSTALPYSQDTAAFDQVYLISQIFLGVALAVVSIPLLVCFLSGYKTLFLDIYSFGEEEEATKPLTTSKRESKKKDKTPPVSIDEQEKRENEAREKIRRGVSSAELYLHSAVWILSSITLVAVVLTVVHRDVFIWGAMDSASGVLIVALMTWTIQPSKTTSSRTKSLALFLLIAFGVALNSAALWFDIAQTNSVSTLYMDYDGYKTLFDRIGLIPTRDGGVILSPISGVSLEQTLTLTLMHQGIHIMWLVVGVYGLAVLLKKTIDGAKEEETE